MPFCTYIHSKPDGTPFYVGKGRATRAYEFSKSRRTQHHHNIISKYGRDNILVCLFPCKSEQDAFELEIFWIRKLKEQGYPLINLTEGGEGASGREMTDRQREALSTGRGPGFFASLSEESQKGILEGLARGRINARGFFNSEEGRAHIVRLSEIGEKTLQRIRENPVKIVCVECGSEFFSSVAKARCCSRLCEQRNRRARDKANAPPKEKYVCSGETRAKMAEKAVERGLKYQRVKQCEQCGAEFISKSHKGKFCSNACSIRSRRAKNRNK
jgi:hypothetical protein